MTRLATTRVDLRSRTLAVTAHGDEVTVTATLEGPRGAHQSVVVLDREQAEELIADLQLALNPGISGAELLRQLAELPPFEDTEEPSDNAYDVPVEVHESGWQWRPCSDDTAFAPPFGTIRLCGCGCLVAGGVTSCARCVADTERRVESHKLLAKLKEDET